MRFSVIRSCWTFLIAAAAIAFSAAGCAERVAGVSTPDDAAVFDTNEERIQVVTVAEGLSFPWSLAFLPDGSMLVTERPGRLRIIRGGVLQPEPIPGVPEVRPIGQGGLLDVVLHPDYAQNSLIYLTYSKPGEGERSGTTALFRARFDGTQLTDGEDIFVADAWSDTTLHFGSRLAFAPDGTLFMTIGERNQRDRAQDPSDHAGTIVRLRDDGSVPDDNPFVGRSGYKPEIYSYGHRNPQGLAIHPETGEVWQNEHGPLGGDEANVVMPGRNYGWPVVTFGREYSNDIITHETWREGMEPPRYVWSPSIGISGLAFYTGDQFPAWSGRMLVGGLSHMVVYLVRLQETSPRALDREAILTQLRQRVRDIRQGPDGLIYVVTDADYARTDGTGNLLRIEPAE